MRTAMAEHIFLTGPKGVGKSTLLQKLLREIPGRIGGFSTKRLNSYHFPAYTVHLLPPTGEGTPTAGNLLFHCAGACEDVAARFDTLGVAALEGDWDLLVMDELGPHEGRAEKFRQAVLEKLDGPIPIFGVLQQAQSEFLQMIASHPSVRLISLTAENRDSTSLHRQILQVLRPRVLYFVRHGQPDFPGGKRMCLGSTDLGLSELGKRQGDELGLFFQAHPICQIFTSPLRRAVQTARAVSPGPVVLPGLRELDMGAWDGLTFEKIRRDYPLLYALRGSDPSLPMPEAEPEDRGLRRFREALAQALDASTGDIALVSHRSILQAFFRSVLGRDVALAYGSVTALSFRGDFRLLFENHIPHEKGQTHENHI